MSVTAFPAEDEVLQAAVAAADETDLVRIGPNALEAAGEVFRALFRETRSAVVVADETTRDVAGGEVERALRGAGVAVRAAHVFPARVRGRALHADFEHAVWLAEHLRAHDAVPVAVGAGTINDLTKLGAHLAERSYLVVATAASMDGYAAFGAAITRDGFKQTISCPAPRGVIGDSSLLASAPQPMTASGFGDLAGKIPAGADWLLADAVGAEALDGRIWEMVQPAARAAIESAEAIGNGEPAVVERLFRCLVMSGLAMQAARSSRPASGAEHQLSHLWEMRDLTLRGEEVSHGFKVGVGAVLVSALYEWLLERDVAVPNVEERVADWPPLEEELDAARREHAGAAPPMRDRTLAEVRAKRVEADALRERLGRLRGNWPELRARLRGQLLSAEAMRRALRAAGCPTEPEQIGLTREEAARSLVAARQIRRRYTVLDAAAEMGLLDGFRMTLEVGQS